MANSKGSSGTTSSPLGDGSSGGSINSPQKFGGIDQHLGPSPKQRMGSDRNPATVAVGGAAPAFDAPAGDRQGQLSGFPLGDARTREPFKLGGATSDSAADEDHETLAGEVPGMTGPEPDQEV